MGPRSGQQWGACFPAACPMCARDTMFHLLMRITGYDARVIGVICAKCNYEVLADSREECEKLKQASKLWQQHEDGELDAASVTSALDELRLATLARIIAEARTWTCPTCQHDNPLNFVTCWNCGQERQLTGDEQGFEEVEAPEADEEE